MTATDPRLEKVRKLLAKAEDPACTTEEAEAFTAKASELIAAYGIDEALLAAGTDDRRQVDDRKMSFSGSFATARLRLVYQIATALGCKGVQTKGYESPKPMPETLDLFGRPEKPRPVGKWVDQLHLFGRPADLDRVEVLSTSLLMQAATQLARETPPPGEDKAAWRRSWYAGFARVAAARLATAERDARRGAEGRFEQAGTSTALVLADRDDDVNQAMRDEYPSLRTTRSRLSGSGGSAGAAAGRSANLGGRSVGGGRRALAR